MPDPTREEMIEALRIEVDRTEGIIDTLKTLASGALSPFPIDTTRDEAHLAALRAVRRELEAGGWPPPILVGRLRADRSTYYICPERPGFHFITGEGESTDDLLKAFREFCVLYDAANSAPPATSDGGEG